MEPSRFHLGLFAVLTGSIFPEATAIFNSWIVSSWNFPKHFAKHYSVIWQRAEWDYQGKVFYLHRVSVRASLGHSGILSPGNTLGRQYSSTQSLLPTRSSFSGWWSGETGLWLIWLTLYKDEMSDEMCSDWPWLINNITYGHLW